MTTAVACYWVLAMFAGWAVGHLVGRVRRVPVFDGMGL